MDALSILMSINEDTMLSAFKQGLNPSLQAVVVEFIRIDLGVI